MWSNKIIRLMHIFSLASTTLLAYKICRLSIFPYPCSACHWLCDTNPGVWNTKLIIRFCCTVSRVWVQYLSIPVQPQARYAVISVQLLKCLPAWSYLCFLSMAFYPQICPLSPLISVLLPTAHVPSFPFITCPIQFFWLALLTLMIFLSVPTCFMT